MSEFVPHPRKGRDLTGRTVGALKVLGYLGKDVHSSEWYLCKCRLCEGRKEYRASHLRSAAVRTCGHPDCRRLAMELRGTRPLRR